MFSQFSRVDTCHFYLHSHILYVDKCHTWIWGSVMTLGFTPNLVLLLLLLCAGLFGVQFILHIIEKYVSVHLSRAMMVVVVRRGRVLWPPYISGW